MSDIELYRDALERIATMPPVNEEFGYQGYDADRMSAIAREALPDSKECEDDWKEKIEAQIAFFRELGYHTGADTLQVLLDVAVAADTEWTVHGLRENSDLLAAIRKLREMGDDNIL